MSTLNKVLIIGRVGQEIKLNHTKAGKAVANFSVATAGYGKDDPTEWHKIIAWDKLAENCKAYLGKGKLCFVEGRITSRPYTNKEGVKMTSTEIIAQSVQFLSPKDESEKGEEKPDVVIDYDSIPF